MFIVKHLLPSVTRTLSVLKHFVVIMSERATWTKHVLKCFPGSNTSMMPFHQPGQRYSNIQKGQHIKVIMFGASLWIVYKTYKVPSPEDWGWKIGTEEYYWKPNWTTFRVIAVSCQELLKCSCNKENCSNRCKCYKAGLSCTTLCSSKC